MNDDERQEIVDGLGFEHKLGYIAYCAARCLAEAERHPQARQQLADAPELTRGLDLLWARAEKQSPIDAKELESLIERCASFEHADDERERVNYTRDICLVEAARTIGNALHFVRDPSLDATYVIDQMGGPYQVMSAVYDDYEHAGEQEEAIADAALQRLHKARSRPFSRALLAGIPEWTRGALSEEYTSGEITGQGEEDGDD